jgi:anti-sigma regulatory factor (Ser/Thr protein kinase)
MRQAEVRQCRIELVSGPTAPAEARQQVRAVIRVWGVPVDADTAELLTSELVTNAFLHDEGEWITLAIKCRHGQLRVDVHDSASGLPRQAQSPEDARDDEAENGRGLMIVETLADEWGFYRDEIGKAVYFTLTP